MTSAPAPDQDERLAGVLTATGLRPTAAPELVTSHSNDTWLLHDEVRGPVVLRICWRGDRARLLRESALGAALPTAAGYPQVLGSGSVADLDLTWGLTRRLEGRSLAQVWPELDERAREAAALAVGAMLSALHRFRPPPELTLRLLPTPLSPDPDVAEVVGRAMNPWPDGVPVLLAAHQDQLPRSLVDEVTLLFRRDRDLAPRLDRDAATVVHGDLHLNNVWSDGVRATGLLDLEWTRPAPPWVDLARLHDGIDEDAGLGRTAHAELVAGLRRGYPELFAVDRLPARLRLVRVAYQLRELAIWPPGAPLDADHPQRRLESLLGAAAQESSSGTSSP